MLKSGSLQNTQGVVSKVTIVKQSKLVKVHRGSTTTS